MLPPILQSSLSISSETTVHLLSSSRHAADTFPTTTPLFSSFEQRASSPAFVECKQGVRSLRRGRKLRREPHRPFCPSTRHFYSQREYAISLSLFPFPYLFHPPHPRPDAVHLTLGLVHAHASLPARLFPSSKGKTLPSQQRAPLCYGSRSWAAFTLRPRAIHAAVMATQRLWGSPRAKPPPCTMGKHDQYLNPPRYAFPLRDACLSLDDLLSPSLFFLLSAFRPLYSAPCVESNRSSTSIRLRSLQEEYDTDASLSSSASSM